MMKIFCFFLFILGIVIGIGIKSFYPLFEVEEKINIVDLATLVASIFIAIYIPVFFEKYLHSKRYEKDVVVKKILDLQYSIKLINKTVNECVQKNNVSKTNSQHILSYFTTISNELNTINTLLNHCFGKTLNNEVEEVNKLRSSYKKAITGRDFQKPNFRYSALEKKTEEKVFQEFDKAVCLLILKINKI